MVEQFNTTYANQPLDQQPDLLVVHPQSNVHTTFVEKPFQQEGDAVLRTTVATNVVDDRTYATGVGYDQHPVVPPMKGPYAEEHHVPVHTASQQSYVDNEGIEHHGMGAQIKQHADVVSGKDTHLTGVEPTVEANATLQQPTLHSSSSTLPSSGTATTGTTTGTNKSTYIDSKGVEHHGLGAKISKLKDKITRKHGQTTQQQQL
jgi:GH24 family phage-related lysozyme (muramidase)